ncbi:MAG: bifunctional DNA-binding transcriptional regulator/O6-methylguanine-DNA methyltransferase Ada [Devosia sp.]
MAENTLDDARWQSVLARDEAADGTFVTAVTTTGIYCRPSCPARHPLRRNVRFFALNREAEAEGFRPCKRCKPNEPSRRQVIAMAVEATCRTLDASQTPPTLSVLAKAAGMSPHHFHRTFRAHTGLTPRGYFDAARAERTQAALREAHTVTGAAFAAGFSSLSRFYDSAATRFGMAPAAMKAGGVGEIIVVAQCQSRLGCVTAGFSRKGVCAVRLTDGPQEGVGLLIAGFPHALVVPGGEDFDRLVKAVAATIEEPQLAEELPLDIRGTAFQERVWAALRAIPIGTTATYSEVAAAIGSPRAHRAVAKACADNRIALLVPCHRVVRSDGSLAGYRWGVERKKTLIDLEKAVG